MTVQNEVDYFSMRLVKLVRMLKLTRCMKASSKVGPYVQELVMGRMEITYAQLQVVKLFSFLIFFTHLQACLWALLSSLTDNGNGEITWLRSFELEFETIHGARPVPWDAYVAALYWSAMTITSIGYGEMLPVNTGERFICSLMMLASGMVWTFVLSTLAGVAATLNPNAVLFQTTMDSLNTFMRERQLPRQMRRQLREYFDHARRVREVSDDAQLLQSMSPLLQGTVAFAANKEWLDKIWWLRMMSSRGTRDSREFIANLAKSLDLTAYVASERPPLGQLYVLRKGMCIKNWNFMRAGRVWGDDLILENRRLMDHSQAVALTYIEVMSISKEAVDSSCDQFPLARQTIDKAALHIRMQRALLLYFCRKRGVRPRSFVAEEDATGYFFVGPQMTTDEKVSVLHEAYCLSHGIHLIQPESSKGHVARASTSMTAERTIPVARAPTAANETPLGLRPADVAPGGGSASVDERFDRLTAMAESTDERLAKLTVSFESFASMLTMRLGAAEKLQDRVALRRSMSTHAMEDRDGDDELAPRSAITKSRPNLPPRGATTAGGALIANDGAQDLTA